MFWAGVIHPMVVAFFLFSSREAFGNGRRPDNDIAVFILIIEQLRRPDIYRRFLMRHDRNDFLILPVYQVFRRSIANSLVSLPANGPHQMIYAIFTTYHLRVSHNVLLV